MSTPDRSTAHSRHLDDYGTLLNPLAREGSLSRAYEREAEVEALLSRFAQAGNRSLLLVGPSGAGKTAILHEAVRRLDGNTHGEVQVLESSTGILMSDTKYLGQWQTKLMGLITAACRPARVVVYMTDIEDILGAGTHDKSDESIGTFLRPYLEKGDVCLVGECTAQQYRRGLEWHAAFRKVLPIIKVEEADDDVVRRILASVAGERAERLRREDGRELRIGPRILDRILEMSRHYCPGQVMPGKAVHLLDQVLALRCDSDDDALDPRQEDVVLALERSTGVPSLLLDDARPLDLEEVRRFFEERVIGQPEAVASVIDLITLVKAGLNDPGKPIGVLSFVGPTGVGKTELAKALAEFIFGSQERLLRLDMSEYKDALSIEKLIGNPQAGGRSPLLHGPLTSAVREQPFSVVLLDEFEKAHPNLYDLFLQVFDDGRLTDSGGNTTDFTQTIIIMTSNLGSEIQQERPVGFKAEARAPKAEDVMAEMKKFFRPEFLNRLDRVIVFRPLGLAEMRTIAQRELGKVLLRGGITRRNTRIDVDAGVVELLLKEGFTREYGARPLKRAVEGLLLLPLGRKLIRLSPDGEPSLLRIHVVGGKVQVAVVKDGEPQEPPAPAGKVTLIDPLRGRKVKLTASAVRTRCQAFQERLRGLEEASEKEGVRERKQTLVRQTGAVSFWDDRDAARRTLDEIQRIERLLSAIARVRKRTDDLVGLAEGMGRASDPHANARLVERYQDVQRDLELVERAFLCRGTLDRCDAFVEVRLVTGDESDDDTVLLLSQMYTRWAVSKGFHVTIVHEEPAREEGSTRRVILLIEGLAVFGVLAGEEGLHEFIRGKGGDHGRSVQHAWVEVLPIPEDEGPRPRTSDISVERRKSAGKGKLIRDLRSRVVLVHRPTGVQAEGWTDRAPDEVQPILEDLLRARLLAREREAAVERTVRKYTLAPNPLVRDVQTGLSTGSLADIFAGGIDEFLDARLAKEKTRR